MSGVGFWELIILLLIGLIVLGPERLPRVASQLGTWLGQARRMTRVMKRQLEEELNFEREQTIRPARLSAPPPSSQPRKEHADDYSPAHAADSVGTGVGTDSPAGDEAHNGESGGEPGAGEPAAMNAGEAAARPPADEPGETNRRT